MPYIKHFIGLRPVRNTVTLGLVVLGPLLVLVTFLTIGTLDQESIAVSFRLVVLADLIYVLLVAAMILTSVVRLVAARRAKSAGSRLHLRLTRTFAILALIPTISVAIFAGITVNVGLEGWFSERVRQVVSISVVAAQAYKQEQKEDLTADVLAVATFIDNRKRQSFIGDAEAREILTQGQQLIQRGLREAYLIDGTGAIRARGDRSYLFDFEQPDGSQISQVIENGILIIEDWRNDEFRALVQLTEFVDRFLYVSREVDGEILNLLDDTRETARLYQQLENERGRVLFNFVILYFGFAVILILAAIWFGLWYAERLSRPVGQLTGAAQRVGSGDLDVQVVEDDGGDEISMLGQYFNQMTRQLKEQREALLENNRKIERRRRLFDSVLSSVTSGVVGLDSNGYVTFVNKSAQTLLNWSTGDRPLEISVAVPEFATLFNRLKESDIEVVQDEIPVTRQDIMENLLVRMGTRRRDDGWLEGFVLTFDDVTDLVSAQRLAAWGDVARRIAHEIKNPLTPIQLSAERIKRKFAPRLGEESDQLEQMTDVIVRQTNDLRHIVDEFSKFARMPKPNLTSEDLVQIVGDVVLLQQTAQTGVKISLNTPKTAVMAQIDATMIGQAITNLIKNAGEAIDAQIKLKEDIEIQPEIQVGLSVDNSSVQISIADNGIGFPADRSRLFEPYVTTRDQGTGLGLAIVRKIVEEHSGSLVLEDAPVFEGQPKFGAMVVITLPVLAVT
ncbi:MAG: PAS domain-containing sensor histidine kinase [Aestuariivita sp.]|nr:PAS domain-containing sensor histidine kinase [Aestuariivita sp.]